MNFALISYYEEIALQTVLEYAREQGIKLRRGDFFMCEDEKEREKIENFMGASDVYKSNRVWSVWKDKYTSGIVYVHLYYTKGKTEDRVKAKVRNFLDYRFVTIYNDKVVFAFTKNDLDIISADRDKGENVDGKRIETVMRQITQLLKFTEENGATEGEAIAASAKVQMLLAKYHLSLGDVTGGRDKEQITQVTAFAGTGKKWKYDLAGAVADGYCCKVFYVGADKVVFYGYETDILAARRIFVYLFNVGDKLANQYIRQEREHRYSTAGVYNSYVSGFIRGVRSEFERNCTALALIVQPEVKESYDKFTEKFKAKNLSLSCNSNFDPEAEQEGFTEGQRALSGRYLES